MPPDWDYWWILVVHSPFPMAFLRWITQCLKNMTLWKRKVKTITAADWQQSSPEEPSPVLRVGWLSCRCCLENTQSAAGLEKRYRQIHDNRFAASLERNSARPSHRATGCIEDMMIIGRRGVLEAQSWAGDPFWLISVLVTPTKLVEFSYYTTSEEMVIALPHPAQSKMKKVISLHLPLWTLKWVTGRHCFAIYRARCHADTSTVWRYFGTSIWPGKEVKTWQFL